MKLLYADAVTVRLIAINVNSDWETITGDVLLTSLSLNVSNVGNLPHC